MTPVYSTQHTHKWMVITSTPFLPYSWSWKIYLYTGELW
jgi:hypothetical protein